MSEVALFPGPTHAALHCLQWPGILSHVSDVRIDDLIVR